MFKIFVGNISFETTEEKLRRIFEPHLEIEDLVIAREAESGKSRGYGFVMTRDPIRGRRAIAQVGKFFIDGRLAYAKEAHGGKKPPPRRGGRRVSHRPRPIRRRQASSPTGNGRPSGPAQSGRPASRGYVGIDPPAPVVPPAPPASDRDDRASRSDRA